MSRSNAQAALAAAVHVTGPHATPTAVREATRIASIFKDWLDDADAETAVNAAEPAQ